MTTPRSETKPHHYTVDADLRVEITVNDPDAMERITGPNGDEWRSQFYRLETVEHVIEHWAYNAIHNHIEDVSRLEGWADLPSDAVTISVDSPGNWTVTAE